MLFEEARDKIIGINRERNGIGTLQEKTVHAVLKHYLAPIDILHEMPIAGYVADIFTGNEIIEIQTGNFNKLRSKLDAFLPLYPVTVVYPIPYQKWLIWINEETGEYTEKRKSPAKGSPLQSFLELYKIKNFLTHENFSLRIIMLDIEEYRLLNGWSKDKKKGSVRFDRIPVKLVDELYFTRVEDYMQLIPEDIIRPFSVKDFSKALKVNTHISQTTLHILFYIGVVNRVGKKGNSFLYDVMY
jgi:hypothetical protein